MPHKDAQAAHAPNPPVRGQDGGEFVTVQFAEVRDVEFVSPKPVSAPSEKSVRERARVGHIPESAQIPLRDVVILVQVVDPGRDLLPYVCQV
jgi:hypothetical protein